MKHVYARHATERQRLHHNHDHHDAAQKQGGLLQPPGVRAWRGVYVTTCSRDEFVELQIAGSLVSS